MDIIDTGEDALPIRQRTQYPYADVFLFIFAIDDPESFMRISNKWIPEVNKTNLGAPKILIGTRMEYRLDKETIDKLALTNQKSVIY